jgi:hypothetical protein
MDEAAAIWTPYLNPGEAIVWSARFSDSLRSADRARVRRHSAIVAVAAAAVAALAGYRFYETVFQHIQAQAGILAAVLAPLYAAFALTLAVLAAFMIRKLLNPPAPDADHYAATGQRLLALDGQGKLVDEMAGANIAGAVFDNDSRPRELHIIPRDGDARMFFIEHIDNLPAVRARIAEIFPEAPT